MGDPREEASPDDALLSMLDDALQGFDDVDGGRATATDSTAPAPAKPSLEGAPRAAAAAAAAEPPGPKHGLKFDPLARKPKVTEAERTRGQAAGASAPHPSPGKLAPGFFDRKPPAAKKVAGAGGPPASTPPRAAPTSAPAAASPAAAAARPPARAPGLGELPPELRKLAEGLFPPGAGGEASDFEALNADLSKLLSQLTGGELDTGGLTGAGGGLEGLGPGDPEAFARALDLAIRTEAGGSGPTDADLGEGGRGRGAETPAERPAAAGARTGAGPEAPAPSSPGSSGRAASGAAAGAPPASAALGEGAAVTGQGAGRTMAPTLSALAANTTRNPAIAEDEAPGGPGAMLSQMLQAMGGGDTGGPGPGMSGIVEALMKQLLAKEVLYQPMRDIGARYPSWLEDNAGSLPAEELARYREQQGHIERICIQYETDPENYSRLMELLQAMQACGQPPQGIVDELAPGLSFGPDGLPSFEGDGDVGAGDCPIQ